MGVQTLKEKYGDTLVFVVPSRYTVAASGNIFSFDEEAAEQLLRCGEWKLRYEMEVDTNYRQIIPYLIVRCGDKVFTTSRLDGDSRLIGKRSIGVGGHIEPFDAVNTGREILTVALLRELHEELKVNARINSCRLVAGICCHATEVDKVHFGLVYLIDVDTEDVSIKETETLKGGWVSQKELLQQMDSVLWETWSKLCIEYVIGGEHYEKQK